MFLWEFAIPDDAPIPNRPVLHLNLKSTKTLEGDRQINIPFSFYNVPPDKERIYTAYPYGDEPKGS